MPEHANTSLYYYEPSVPIAVIGAIAFAVVLVVYVWRFTQYHAWYFWAMYIGLLCKTVLRLRITEELTRK